MPLKVLVTVGTGLEPFDRLIDMVDDAIEEGNLVVEGLVQFGSCRRRSRHLDNTRSMARPEFRQRMAEADIVVCHGGVGTLRTALDLGHRPIVLPRLLKHREVVNDHQVDIVKELATKGRVHAVSSASELTALLAAAATDNRAPSRSASGAPQVPRKVAERIEGPPAWQLSYYASKCLEALAKFGPSLETMSISKREELP